MEAQPRILRVDNDDPLVVSCAVCGWAPDAPPDPSDLLPWPVIVHWLTEHWDGP